MQTACPINTLAYICVNENWTEKQNETFNDSEKKIELIKMNAGTENKNYWLKLMYADMCRCKFK